MSVGRAWVIEQLGGEPTAGNVADVIKVARTDDAGNTTFLTVSIADLSADPIVFTVTAPGLSSYTLMALQPAVAPPDEGTNNTTLIIIVAIIAVVLLGAGLFFLVRRRTV